MTVACLSPRLARCGVAPFFLERNPNPEPAHGFDEHEGKEDTVLKSVAAPARGDVAGGRVGVG